MQTEIKIPQKLSLKSFLDAFKIISTLYLTFSGSKLQDLFEGKTAKRFALHYLGQNSSKYANKNKNCLET
jgi:hypothetical protein